MSVHEGTAPAVRVARARRSGGRMLALRVLWAKVTEPRHMSVIYCTVYLITLLTGLVTLTVPPQTVENELGAVLAAAWAALFILGGLVGMVTVLPGWWLWERWAIILSLSGIGIYGYVIVVLHFAGPGSRLTQLGVLAMAAALFVVRWAFIRGRSYGPRG